MGENVFKKSSAYVWNHCWQHKMKNKFDIIYLYTVAALSSVEHKEDPYSLS